VGALRDEVLEFGVGVELGEAVGGVPGCFEEGVETGGVVVVVEVGDFLLDGWAERGWDFSLVVSWWHIVE